MNSVSSEEESSNFNENNILFALSRNNPEAQYSWLFSLNEDKLIIIKRFKKKNDPLYYYYFIPFYS